MYIIYVHNNIHLCAIRIKTHLSSVRVPTFKYSRTWSNWPLLSRQLFRYNARSRVISLRGVPALEISKNENLIWGSSATLLLSVKLHQNYPGLILRCQKGTWYFVSCSCAKEKKFLWRSRLTGKHESIIIPNARSAVWHINGLNKMHLKTQHLLSRRPALLQYNKHVNDRSAAFSQNGL